MKELLAILAARRAHPTLPFALATVVGVTGSSYRRPGARMLIGASGRVAGSVSGGCLEEDVILHGQRVMASGQRHVARYDTADEKDIVFGTGLGCRGQIEILIEPLLPDQPWPLAEAVARVAATRTAERFASVVHAGGPGPTASGSVAEPTAYPCRQALAGPDGAVDVFVEHLAPAPALVIFGGGPDVTPLVRLAREIGYHLTVIDRRRALVDSFPEADRFVCARPGQPAARACLEPGCAVVVMNHHYETDREALEAVLPFKARYVGQLGPRDRTDRLLDELAERGTTFTPDALERLHAPAGLDLGGAGPEQIALSILAEIQACASGRGAGKLRARTAPINAR